METEAGGQLGGLDTTDEVRKRFATESGSWRCPICQLSNAEIIKDCEEKSQQSLSKESEVSIPQELKLAWKDQLSDDSPAVNDPGKASDGVELAEGFVRRTPDMSIVSLFRPFQPTKHHPHHNKDPRPQLVNRLRAAYHEMSCTWTFTSRHFNDNTLTYHKLLGAPYKKTMRGRLFGLIGPL